MPARSDSPFLSAPTLRWIARFLSEVDPYRPSGANAVGIQHLSATSRADSNFKRAFRPTPDKKSCYEGFKPALAGQGIGRFWGLGRLASLRGGVTGYANSHLEAVIFFCHWYWDATGNEDAHDRNSRKPTRPHGPPAGDSQSAPTRSY